jgi:hypothetical protein
MGKPEMSRKTRYDPCFETIYAVGFIEVYMNFNKYGKGKREMGGWDT